MTDDYDFDFNLPENPVKTGGRGGARPNAGRPKGSPTINRASDDTKNFNKAATREKVAKANMAEIEFKIKSREYISREQVRDACATTLAAIAQALRSIPDLLEKEGLEPNYCEVAEGVIDSALVSAATKLEKLTADAEGDDE